MEAPDYNTLLYGKMEDVRVVVPKLFFFSQPKTTCSTICKYGSAGVPMFRPHCSIHRRRGRWSFGYVTELLVNVATRLVLAGLYSQNSCVKAREWMYGRK